MRNNSSSKSFRLVALVTLFAFVFYGCAHSIQFPYPELKNESDRYQSISSGLRISVDPFTQDEKLDKFFGCDLLSRGVLPVFLVINNLDAEDGYVLINENTRLITKYDSNDINTMPSDGQPIDDNRSTIKTTNSSIGLLWLIPIIGPLIFVGTLPFMMVGGQKVKNEDNIRYNITKKQISERIIYKGDTHSGFIYFKVVGKEAYNKIVGIKLIMKNKRTDDVINFTININLEQSR